MLLSAVRRPLKAFFESVSSIGAERAVAKHGARGSTLILSYHNVIPEHSRAGGDASLHLGLDQFRRQLDVLARCTRMVSIEEALRRCADTQSRDDRPLVAISFDDAYDSAVSVALPELAARSVPATVFVAPALLGATSTWWDAYLGHALRESDERRTFALESLSGDTSRITEYAIANGWTAGAGAAIASEAALTDAAALPGVTFGAHSMTHPNLARLTPDHLAWELAASHDWLRARFDVFRPWLAYPYGLTTPDVERAAMEAGYSAAFLVDGAWATGQGSPFARPRLNVASGVSDRGFLLRLARR